MLLVGLSVATDALRAGVSWSASTSPQVRHGAVCSLRAAVEGDSRSRIVLESDAAVGRYICERVEAIGLTHFLNPGERWPSCDLNVMSHLAAQGLDGRRAVRWTRKL